MNTIKIQTWDNLDPVKGQYDRQIPAKRTYLYEGKNINYRAYEMGSYEQFISWKENNTYAPILTILGISGHNKLMQKKTFEEILEHNANEFVEFTYLTFEDKNSNLTQLLIEGANVYIMNEQGQTIDQFCA